MHPRHGEQIERLALDPTLIDRRWDEPQREAGKEWLYRVGFFDDIELRPKLGHDCVCLTMLKRNHMSCRNTYPEIQLLVESNPDINDSPTDLRIRLEAADHEERIRILTAYADQFDQIRSILCGKD